MSWDRIEGQWKQRRGKAQHHWGKMMNDELAAIAGKYEELIGRLQESYGIAKEGTKSQSDEFNRTIELLKESNNKLIEAQKTTQKTLSKRKKADRKPLKSKTPIRKRARAKKK